MIDELARGERRVVGRCVNGYVIEQPAWSMRLVECC